MIFVVHQILVTQLMHVSGKCRERLQADFHDRGVVAHRTLQADKMPHGGIRFETLHKAGHHYIARITRAGTIEALDADYTRTAVLKGLPRRTVVRRHVLRNSLLPTIAVIATQTGYLIGGLVVIPGVWEPFLHWIDQTAEPLVQATVTEDYGTSAIAVSLALVGFLIARRAFRSRRQVVPSPSIWRVLEHKLYFDELYDALFYRPAVALATAAPNGPSNAQQTIKELQSQGYTVIVNRLGSAPLDEATVVAVGAMPSSRPSSHLSSSTAGSAHEK